MKKLILICLIVLGMFVIIVSCDNPVNQENLNEDLRIFAKYGDLTNVKISIEKGADPNFGGKLPLKLAAKSGHIEVVKYLVDHGAIITKDALEWAVSNDRFSIVKYFVEHGADINNIEPFRIKSADMCEFLIKLGANNQCRGDSYS